MKRLLCAFLLFFSLSTSLQAADLTVKSFSPKGEVKGRPVISVTFTEAVVAKNQVGKTLTGTKVPLHIRPALEGSALWATPDRLEFRPKQNIPPATEYFVDFGPGGLKSHKGKLLAGPQSFTFRSEPMKWLTCEQVNYTNSDEIVLVLSFSAPVTPQRLTGFLTLKDQNNSLVRYRVDGNKPSKEVTIITDPASDVETLFIELSAGLKADVGTLSTEEVRTGKLEVKRIVEVTNAYASTSDEQKGSITIQLTVPVNIDNVKGYVSLSPDIPFTISSSWHGFVINGNFSPRSRVSVTIKKGLGGSAGLQRDYKRDFIFPDIPSRLSFASSGLFLTPTEEPRIALEATNINEVSLSLHRVYNNNLPLILSSMDSWGYGSLTQWSKELETKKFLFNGEQNKTTRRAVNLNWFDEKPSGLYLIHARSEDEDTWENDTALVNISDMALSAKTYRQGIQLWASTISTTEPIAQGKVSVYSAKNQLLAQGMTDKDGLLTLLPETPWSGDQQPAIAVLEKDDDITFVLLGEDQLSSRGIDTAGAPWPDGAEALWILPRNIWQPGETLQAQMVLRDAKGLPVKPLPLRWVLTSQNLDVASGVITPDELGTVVITADIPLSIATGPAQLRLQIPGNDNDVASRTIQIEEFSPPQIEVDFINPPKVLIATEKHDIEFQSRYLFGAPASELAWQMSFSAVPLNWESKAHSGYFFGAIEIEKLGRPRGDIGEESLDLEGLGTAPWNSDVLAPLHTPMEVFLRLNVMEKGGRWTGKTLRLPWLPDEALVGVLPPKDWVKPQQKCTVPLVVIDSEDKPLSRELTVIVSRVHDRWTMVTENGRNRVVWQEDVVEKSQEKLNVDGKGSFSFTPDEEGEWELSFMAGNFTTTIRVSVWRHGQATALTGPENLALSTNQKTFKAGEKATVAVKSPFAGTLFVATGSDRPLSLQRLKLDGTEGSFSVSTEGMEPNGWCVATVTRPGSMETKPPYRAMGALPLVMNLENHKLSVTVTGPEEIEPGPLNLSFAVKNHQGQPVDGTLTIALVDRGILGLTNVDNEDPWAWFTRLRRSGGLLADIFDQLRPIEDRSTALLHPAGGDMEVAPKMMSANADLYSPVSAADYKPTSLWFTELPVKNGEASLNAVIPDFTGSLRIEVLAYNSTGLGRETSRVNVARPVMIQGTMPRYVTPGDEFKPHLQFFSSLKGDGALTVTLLEGLTFDDGKKEHKASVAFKNGKAEMVLPTMKVGSDSGTARLEVQLTFGDHSITEKYSIANRPGSPHITYSGGDKIDGTTQIELPGKWFPGTTATSVTLAGSPLADATRLLDLLGNWGTRIQWLTARAWASRSLPIILDDQELVNEEEVHMHIPSLLFNIQALQNHDGSWSRWSNDAGDLWLTASVMHLMTALKKDNVDIERHTWLSGLRYLRRAMNEPLPDSKKEIALNLDARAYSCFVLASAGEAPLGWMNWLGDQAKNLSERGNALLAAAWAVAGNRERATTLLGGNITPPQGASKNDTWWISEVTTLAFRLLAHETIAPGSVDGRNTAERIANTLKGKDLYWIDSKQSGFILMTLAIFEENNPASGGTAMLTNEAGEEILNFTGEKPVTWSGTDTVPLSLKTEDGAVWYSWTSSGVPVTATPPFAKGIEVTAQLLDANGKPLKNETVQFGQVVSLQVTAKIRTPQPAVRLSILLPGGLEAEEAGSMDDKQAGTVRADKRFDRVILNAQNAGKTVIWTVPCRAVFRGTFNVPSVAVDVPANPGMGALGQTSSLTIH